MDISIKYLLYAFGATIVVTAVIMFFVRQKIRDAIVNYVKEKFVDALPFSSTFRSLGIGK